MYLLQKLSVALYAAAGSVAALAFVAPAFNDSMNVLVGRREGPLFGTPKPLDQLAETAEWFGWADAQALFVRVSVWAGAENHVPVEMAVASMLVFSGFIVFLFVTSPDESGPWQALTLTWLALAVLAQIGVGVWPFVLAAPAGFLILGSVMDGLKRRFGDGNYPPAGRGLRLLTLNFVGTLVAGPVLALASAHGLLASSRR